MGAESVGMEYMLCISLALFQVARSAHKELSAAKSKLDSLETEKSKLVQTIEDVDRSSLKPLHKREEKAKLEQQIKVRTLPWPLG